MIPQVATGFATLSSQQADIVGFDPIIQCRPANCIGQLGNLAVGQVANSLVTDFDMGLTHTKDLLAKAKCAGRKIMPAGRTTSQHEQPRWVMDSDPLIVRRMRIFAWEQSHIPSIPMNKSHSTTSFSNGGTARVYLSTRNSHLLIKRGRRIPASEVWLA